MLRADMVKLPSSVLSLSLLPPCSLSTSHLTSHHSTWYASLTASRTRQSARWLSLGHIWSRRMWGVAVGGGELLWAGGPGGSIGELAASRLPCLQLSCKPPPCLSTTTSPWFSCFGLEIGRYMFVTRNLKANGKQKKMDSVSRLPCLQLSCPQTSCTQHPCSSAGPFGKFERT